MLRTPAGRIQVGNGIAYRLWPVLSRLGRLYRVTAARNVRLTVVVGSFGKSTTTRAVATALAAPLPKSVLANAWSSIALRLLRTRPTQEHAVIEVGIAAPGQMARYARMLRPDTVVVTSIGSEHQRTIGSLDAIRDEKARMVEELQRSGTAVLNGDDANVIAMKERTQARVVTFGFDEACDVQATRVSMDWPEGMRFHVRAFGEEREARIRLIGRHMVYPALAAIAVARVHGLSLDDTLLRLESVPPTPGRMEPVALPNGSIALRDDYKSTLETIHVALEEFAEIPVPGRVVMLGDVWDPPEPEDPIYEALGARVARIASHFVVVGENLQRYEAGALPAGMEAQAVTYGGHTPQEAAEALRKVLRPGDVVLIKGRRSQRLDRVRMILQGRSVRCDLDYCDLRTIDCEECPMLEIGWAGHRAIWGQR